MRVLYKYLTQGPVTVMSGSSGAGPGSPAGAGGGDGAHAPLSPSSRPDAYGGGFLTGPEDLKDPETPINAPRVFVTAEDGEDNELHLVIYASDEIKTCFLVERSTIHNLDFYRELTAFIGESLHSINSNITDQQQKRTSVHPEVQYKYLYFNHMNLAQKSSFMTLPKKYGQPTVSTVSAEYIQYLTDMHTDFAG